MPAVADGAVCTGNGGTDSCSGTNSCCVAMKVNVDAVPSPTNLCVAA